MKSNQFNNELNKIRKILDQYFEKDKYILDNIFIKFLEETYPEIKQKDPFALKILKRQIKKNSSDTKQSAIYNWLMGYPKENKKGHVALGLLNFLPSDSNLLSDYLETKRGSSRMGIEKESYLKENIQLQKFNIPSFFFLYNLTLIENINSPLPNVALRHVAWIDKIQDQQIMKTELSSFKNSKELSEFLLDSFFLPKFSSQIKEIALLKNPNYFDSIQFLSIFLKSFISIMDYKKSIESLNKLEVKNQHVIVSYFIYKFFYAQFHKIYSEPELFKAKWYAYLDDLNYSYFFTLLHSHSKFTYLKQELENFIYKVYNLEIRYQVELISINTIIRCFIFLNSKKEILTLDQNTLTYFTLHHLKQNLIIEKSASKSGFESFTEIEPNDMQTILFRNDFFNSAQLEQDEFISKVEKNYFPFEDYYNWHKFITNFIISNNISSAKQLEKIKEDAIKKGLIANYDKACKMFNDYPTEMINEINRVKTQEETNGKNEDILNSNLMEHIDTLVKISIEINKAFISIKTNQNSVN